MRRTWFDVLLDAAGRAPGPRWVAVVVGSIIMALPQQLAEWATTRPFPDIYAPNVVGATTPILFLWVAVVLDDVARGALRRLRPALALSDDAVREIEGTLLRTPSWIPFGALVVGVPFGVQSVLDNPTGWSVDLAVADARLYAAVGVSVLTTVVLLAFLGRLVHQLRLVATVHRDQVVVDLFHLEPLYAFSAFTSRAGVLLILVVTGVFAGLSLTIGSAFGLGASDLAILASLLGIAVACFVVPLLGLHDRIADAKAVRLAEAQSDLAVVLREVRARVGAGDIEGVGRTADAITAANAAVTAIGRVSTWPWRPETLRGFASAIGLPVALWLITEGLRRALSA